MRKFKVVFLMFFLIKLYGQQPMSPKDAFLYVMQVNKQDPYSVIYDEHDSKFNWMDIYSTYFDLDNYLKSKNDEFKWGPYYEKTKAEINIQKKSIAFNKTFYVMSQVTFNSYNSDCGCFPITQYDFNSNLNHNLLAIKKVGNFKLWYDATMVNLKIAKFFNIHDFDYNLKMKKVEAEKFVDLRKDKYGKVNRTLLAKVIYNVLDKPINRFNVGAYINKIEYYDNERVLYTIYPKNNYFDKIHFIKIQNGIEKSFFNDKWEQINERDSSSAPYFRLTKLKDGKIDGLVTDYFKSGAKQMESEYSPYGDFHSGTVKYFFENGNLHQQETYINNKIDSRIVWYENGFKKSQENFKFGAVYGCKYTWTDYGAINFEYFVDENNRNAYGIKCPEVPNR